jgi:hypothetical protein
MLARIRHEPPLRPDLFVRGFVSRAFFGRHGLLEPASAEERRNSWPRTKIARPRFALHE